MHWRCDICDKVMYEDIRSNLLQSGFHKRLASSIVGKYFITNLKSIKIDDTFRNYLISHFKNYENFQVTLPVKLLMPSKQI